MTNEIAGSYILDMGSLFFLGGLLMYTSLFRKRGRVDDKLFFAMVLVDMVLAVADGASYLLQVRDLPMMRELMTGCNLVFYCALEIFPCLYTLYVDFRRKQSRERLKQRAWVCNIPCFAALILLAVNMRTGMLYTIDEAGVFSFGPWNSVLFLPVAFYVLYSMWMLRKELLLLWVSSMLVASRILLGIWCREISSTAFTYALFLAGAHLYSMNMSMNEEAP